MYILVAIGLRKLSLLSLVFKFWPTIFLPETHMFLQYSINADLGNPMKQTRLVCGPFCKKCGHFERIGCNKRNKIDCFSGWSVPKTKYWI